MEARFRSTRFGLSDILTEGWKIIQAGAATFLPLGLLYALVNAIVLYISTGVDYANASDIETTMLCLQCVVSLVVMVFSLTFTIAQLYLVEGMVQGRPASLGEALRYAFSRLPAVLLVNIVYAVIVGIGFVLLFIPGVILGIYFTFAIAIVALRKIDLPALQYSLNLVRGQWWRIFGILLGLGIPIAAISYLINWLAGISAPYIGFGTIVFYILGSVITFLVGVPTAVLYLNNDYVAPPVQAAPANPEGDTTGSSA